MIKCNKCNAKLADNAVFCSNCGEKLVKNKTCPECQAICDNSVKFCSQCGFNFTAASKTQPQPDKKSKSASEISDDELAALNQALKNSEIPDVDDDNDDDQEPDDCFDIFLDGCPENKKMAVTKEIHQILNIGLEDALDYLNFAPVCILRDVSSYHHAEEIKRLKKSGAKIRFEKGHDYLGKNMTTEPLQIEPLPKKKKAKKITESITTEKDSEKIHARKKIDALLRQIVETSAVSYPVRIKGNLDAGKLKKAYSKIVVCFHKAVCITAGFNIYSAHRLTPQGAKAAPADSHCVVVFHAACGNKCPVFLENA